MTHRPLLTLYMLLLTACAAPSTYVLTGTARAPIAPEDVKVYSQPPPVYFEEVALLNASSTSAFNPANQAAFDKVIERLKIQAAKLGANAIVLGGFSDRQTGSIGTGVGSTSYSRSSAVGVGVGGSFGIFKKTGQAKAVYIAPGAPQGFPLIPSAPPQPPPPPPAQQ